MTEERYKVPAGDGQGEYVEQKSRFLSFVHHVENQRQTADIIADYKKRFWDASHVCYAYVLRSGEMKYSDAGEPKGTAGLPALEVLRREEIFNVICVIVRYFGGTLLGAGGLTRAYAKAAKLALDDAGVGLMVPMVKMVARDFPYKFLDVVRHRCELCGAREIDCEFGENVTAWFSVEEGNEREAAKSVSEATAGAVELEPVSVELFIKKL